MELTVFIPDEDIKTWNKENILFAFREALIGELFLKAKAEYERSHNDGLITAAEYGRLLVGVMDQAYEETKFVMESVS